MGSGPLPACVVPGAGKARVAAGFVPSLVDAHSWLERGAEKAVASTLPSVRNLKALTQTLRSIRMADASQGLLVHIHSTLLIKVYRQVAGSMQDVRRRCTGGLQYPFSMRASASQ